MQAVQSSHVLVGNPSQFYKELADSKDIARQLLRMLAISMMTLGVYGGILGLSHSPLQALSSAIKLPFLFLATLAITFPTFYVLNTYQGAQLGFARQLNLFLGTVSLTGIVLVSFAPVSIFFLVTTSSYEVFKLLNVSILAFAGLIGIRFLWRGTQELSTIDPRQVRRIVGFWIFLYAIVGCQLAWLVRPFFGSPDLPFALFRERSGDFFSNVLGTIGAIF